MKQNTLTAQDVKDHIKYILASHHGRANAISNSELARLTKTHIRYVQIIIRDLISEGIPIASSCDKPHGYFIAGNWEEADIYSESLKNRLIENARRRRDFRRSALYYLTPAKQEKLF